MSVTKLLFYTKKDCPLCVEGYATTARVAKRFGLEVVKVDIQADGALFERFKERIPVVEADGEELAWGRISERGLTRLLTIRLDTAGDS